MGKITYKWYKLDHQMRLWVNVEQNLSGIKPIGVYALYNETGLIYIGHSSDIITRITNHEKEHTLAKIKLFEGLTKAKEVEEKLIRRLKPPMNKDFTKVETETKTFSCALELDVWKAIKIKHAVKDMPVADIVNDALREQLERWIEIGNEAS
jgi:predicted GIY-YIG superfamily endonuclease